MFHTFILRQRRIAAELKRFHLSPLSVSSVQPLLDLAVELNPELAGRQSHPPLYPAAAPRSVVGAHLGATEAV